jgi:hypothetical protein
MKLKRVNNETTKNNKIMEQETANVRGDNDRPTQFALAIAMQ